MRRDCVRVGRRERRDMVDGGGLLESSESLMWTLLKQFDTSPCLHDTWPHCHLFTSSSTHHQLSCERGGLTA